MIMIGLGWSSLLYCDIRVTMLIGGMKNQVS